MHKHIDLVKLEAFRLMLRSQLKVFAAQDLTAIENETEKSYIEKILNSLQGLDADLGLILSYYKDKDMEPTVIQRAGVNFLNTQALLQVAPMVGEDHKLNSITDNLRGFLSTAIDAVKAIESLYYMFMMGARTFV